MNLSIILLNYNTTNFTIKCIQSLYVNYKEQFEGNSFEVIVVDNASNPDEVAALVEETRKSKYKNIVFVKNSQNVGFSKGCNIGAGKAKGDVLLFLNNDTVVKDKGILDMLGYISKNPGADIVGGMLSNSDGSEQPSVGNFYTPFNALLLLLGLQRAGVVNKNPAVISEVDWVKGGCMMVRRRVFEKLLGFDENLFMYIEDMEFCYRAKKAGHKVFFYPFVKIEHEDQGSSSRTFAVVNIYENLLYFYKKHRGRAEYLFLKSVLKTKAAVLIVVGRLTNNKYLINTYEKAFKVA
jgi:GT2 family glycosyltransferase